MALQTSGQISLNDIHVEVGGNTGTEVSLNDSDVRGLLGKASGAQNAINEYYGASSNVDLDGVATAVVINGQNSLQEITVSDYISSGGQLTIPTGWWIWSDNTSNAGMTIDIPCTVVNNGYIIGRGGNGAGTIGYNGTAGGPAIRINSGVSGVTIINNTGAFIAGGGGGGGTQNANGQRRGGGGGGAGGGQGGTGYGTSAFSFDSNVAYGAVINAAATQSAMVTSQSAQAGGVAGYVRENSSGSLYQGAHGSGGGRILPGAACNPTVAYVTQYGGDGAGGAGGQVGAVGQRLGTSGSLGAGGGGWGARGGNGSGGRTTSGSGGAGGKGVEPTGNTYTLTNNGTIFGATT